MALRAAIASGNWSNPAIWNNGVLPSPNDVVASNGFTITIDQNITVDTLTNTVQTPVIITPAMTSNTTPSGIVSASSSIGTLYDSWKAFDRVESSSEWLTSGATTGWLAYEFPTARAVGRYVLVPPSNQSPTSIPRDWTFEGWNGSTWVILDTVTGNSGTANVTRTLANTTAYIRYRINITLNNGSGSYTGMRELYLYETNEYTINTVAGGGFILGENVTLNCTGSIPGGATTVLTWNGAAGTTSTINTPFIFGASVAGVNNVFINGTGTLNINVTRITGATSNVTSRTLFINTNCTINIIGDVAFGPSTSAIVVLVNSVCTLNITGTITHNVGSSLRMLSINAAAIVNITGSVICSANSSSNSIISIGSGAIVTITGSITNTSTASDTYAIDTGSACSLRIVGSITGGFASPSVRSTSSSAINLYTGPFISSSYGFVPLQVVRMHLIPTATSYFEFRDETTNGAVSPAAPAPATQLVSPASVSDGPAIANVRFGTTYALGTLTGTLRMPHPNQVTFGIAVDNTFGAAVLTAASVWDYLVANITVENSIGMRLKNVSTPQITGEQLEAFLRLD